MVVRCSGEAEDVDVVVLGEFSAIAGDDVLGVGNGITPALLHDIPQIGAFPLGLENAAGLALNEQHVIRRAGVGVHFTDGYAE